MNSRFKSMPFMGDTLDYSPMELTFTVNENLENYREIHDWMTGIGFPKDNEQFENVAAEVGTKNQTLHQKNLQGLVHQQLIHLIWFLMEH